MSRDDILRDLNFATQLAKDGRNTPLLGGPIGLMWGVLLFPTLIIHGLTLLGKTPIPIESVGLIWMVYGISGAILHAILGRQLRDKTGAGSTLNKIAGALGVSMGIIIFSFAIATVYAVLTLKLPVYTYNIIVVFAFGMGCINLSVLAAMTGKSYLRMAAIAAGIIMGVTMMMVTQTSVYFVAAIGVVLTQIIPNLLEMKAERAYSEAGHERG